MARITPDEANPQGRIDPADFISPSEVTKTAALQLCVQDAKTAEAWIQSNYWSLRYREADALYQSPPAVIMWEGTTMPKSNVNRFVVAETVNAIRPQIMNGLFYEEPPFVLRPGPSVKQNTARAIQELLGIQLKQINIRQEVDWGVFSALTFGTAIFKYGFKSYIKTGRKYVRSDDGITVPPVVPGDQPTELDTLDSVQYLAEDFEEDCHEPTFEAKDIRFVLVDPGCNVPDIRKAKFVIDRMYMTYKQLLELKDEQYMFVDPKTKKRELRYRYDLPSEETIKEWFTPPVTETPMPDSDASTSLNSTYLQHAEPKFTATTVDPLDEPLEVLERWDNNKVITVIQRVKVIRNEENEWGCIPFLSLNWWDVPSAFWGLGLGRVIGVEQRVQAGLINACLDLASLIVNPMYVVSKGANVQPQQVRQRLGGIITVEGETSKAFDMLQSPRIDPEILQQIGMSEARVERTSGANNQLTMGASASTGGKGQLGRSGTGAAGIIQATMNRIGGFAELFVRQVYEPLLYAMHQMNKDKLPVSYIQKVLGEKLGPEFKFDHKGYFSAEVDFEVLAGSHLAAKAQMGQSLFMMLQLFENPALMEQLTKISKKKVNIEELFHMVHDLSGFKNYYDIIVDMTPEEIAAQEAAEQAQSQMAGIQGKMMLSNQNFQQDQQIIDQKSQSQLASKLLGEAAKASASPELMNGTASATQGFGSKESA